MVETKPIEIYLSIDVKNDDIFANVHFHNNTSDIIYLDTWTICINDIMTRNVFSIVDEDDRRIVYSGMMAKREIVPEDFLELAPGESVQTRITINKDYELIKGHKYVIRYCAYNPTYLGKQRLMELLSNKVEITY